MPPAFISFRGNVRYTAVGGGEGERRETNVVVDQEGGENAGVYALVFLT